MGYTPVFSTIYDGTLYGKWPAAALFASLLPLADKHGHIDMSPQAISGRTGWPIELLTLGLSQLCEPDTLSRNDAEDGRRLALLDPDRPWGWRIVNHAFYREKARKAMQQIDATASGRDAERKRIEREKMSGGVRRSPAESSADRPSDADADSDKEVEGAKAPLPTPEVKPKKPASIKTGIPQDFELTNALRDYAIAKLPDVHVDEMFSAFCDKAKAKGWKNVDWAKTWQVYVSNAAPTSGHFSKNDYPRLSARKNRGLVI